MSAHSFTPKHNCKLGLGSPTSPVQQQAQFRHPFLPSHVRLNHPNSQHQIQVRPPTAEYRPLVPIGAQSPSQATPNVSTYQFSHCVVFSQLEINVTT